MNRYHLGLLAVIAIGFVFFVLLIPMLRNDSATIDCGPEGKPVQNGTACIDRNPVFIEK
jgi:hypothetical protein